MSKPLIFITNDDGIQAKGLRFLIDILKEIGDIVVVAPDGGRSGMSHALTVSTPLRLEKITEEKNYIEYKCSGTPVDCLKLSLSQVLKRKPDLLVSGINHGSNASINLIYSGTVAAAIDGALHGIKSIAFSITNNSHDVEVSHYGKYIKKIVLQTLENDLPLGTCLNVNFPCVNENEIKGIKVGRQSIGCWNDYYIERTDPMGRNYYWLTGDFNNIDNDDQTDEWAIANKYISIVPIHVDYTNHKAIELLKNYEI